MSSNLRGDTEKAAVARREVEAFQERDLARQELTDQKRDNASLRRRLEHQQREIDGLTRIGATLNRDLQIPRWTRTPRKTAGHHATLVAMLSDTHFDEVINPEEVRHFNAYNREIAELRLRRFVDRAIALPRAYMKGVDFDGLCLVLGGDLFSGNIHPELVETNEDTVLGSIDHWSDYLAATLGMLTDEFGQLYVVSTVGNHPRFTTKERTKRRVRDNGDWAIARNLARHFRTDDRITFNIPESIDVPFELYDSEFLLYHGQAGPSAGSGVGGIWPTIMKIRNEKRQLYGTRRTVLMGHWHQYVPATEQGVLVNGSLKGYDEFSVHMRFPLEEPQQALFTVTPERGITNHYRILVADRAAEGW